MANFAILENEIVINIIVADSKIIAEQATGFSAVEYTDDNFAKIGQTYDSVNNVFYTPEEVFEEIPTE